MKLENYLKNKKILVVGPSSSLLDDCKNINVGSYDIICKINDHWRVEEKDREVLTRRTDMICHCMGEKQYNKNDLKIWKNKGIRLLSSLDMDKFPNHPKSLCFKKRNEIEKINVDCIPHNKKIEYLNILHSNPSTGVLLILYLLSFEIKNVTVVGFDFYDSLYIHKKDDGLLNRIKNNKIGNHNPIVQFKYFKEYIKNEKRFIPVGKLKEKLGF